MKKICSKCGIDFYREKHGRICKYCEYKRNYEKRKSIGFVNDKKYERTKMGFLMRKYRNMQSRTLGIQKNKAHLYMGLELLDRDLYYFWANCCEEFHLMFKEWEDSNYNRKLCPTVDRVDSSKGYVLENMRWLTHSENSSRVQNHSSGDSSQ